MRVLTSPLQRARETCSLAGLGGTAVIDEDLIALFAHGHVLRVLVARWIGLRAGAGQHFLLDTGTLNVLGYYCGIPAVKIWNALVKV